jgi:hypothetical protein
VTLLSYALAALRFSVIAFVLLLIGGAAARGALIAWRE